MIKEGTRLIIEGVPYRIINAIQGQIGRYMLAIEVDNTISTDIRLSIASLMERLSEADDKFYISKQIVSWFVDEKLKSGINVNQMLAIKHKPETAEQQVRRLMKNGEDVQTIIEVLAFCVFDKFWSGILNTSINTIAIPRKDGLSLYEKIKSKMIAERHANIDEVHQLTPEEMEGVIVVE